MLNQLFFRFTLHYFASKRVKIYDTTVFRHGGTTVKAEGRKAQNESNSLGNEEKVNFTQKWGE